MLVLTRRAGQRIRLGDDVVVTVVSVEGHQVRIGIEAPRSLPIRREEIYVALAAANQKAAGGIDDLARSR
ncbi:MAG: carbon storage regulator CsrA [Acidimicrobiales bacterium]